MLPAGMDRDDRVESLDVRGRPAWTRRADEEGMAEGFCRVIRDLSVAIEVEGGTARVVAGCDGNESAGIRRGRREDRELSSVAARDWGHTVSGDVFDEYLHRVFLRDGC